ncbi:hypothetical protein [Paenibacillus campinasensis]|uniref:Uncharacterized protein n=1 Tax=Paenibacillus campinasensis TaxID=66347 RepID=A0A268EH38_9BACL|nr:hypothetical protein [Paenibacillus campinasensis]PAD72399.1 hypothetical protein CHH67_22420 [Paenibacillus campinasensis]
MTTENKRDLAADLAICEAATDGPWEWLADIVDNDTLRGDGGYVCHFGSEYRGLAGEEPYEDDKRFIAEAREGWPEAIRRAMAAEEQVGALIELLREAIDMITPNETDYKCDYRRRYVRHQIGKIVPEVGEDE